MKDVAFIVIMNNAMDGKFIKTLGISAVACTLMDGKSDVWWS
jgi:hypothetical protein